MNKMVGKGRSLPPARTLALCLLAALLLAGTALGEVSREGLVGEWHFDGDAKDASGNGNDGTIYGASFVEGKFGKALSAQKTPGFGIIISISVVLFIFLKKRGIKE